MVIHQSGVTPTEITSSMDSKKYIVVKNHVRELLSEEIQNNEHKCSTNTSQEICEKVSRKRKKSSDKSSEISDNQSEILNEDLEELKTVYYKCRAILSKIESKYGHLLDLSSDEHTSNKKQKLYQEKNECNCVLNKKIVFDEEGKQIYRERLSNVHICPKKVQSNNYSNTNNQVINVSTEDDPCNQMLPDNVPELCEILKNSDISYSFRKQVINKIKFMRHQNFEMIRLDKSSLIKNIKSNPSDFIEFKGSNISTLQGYLVPSS